MIEIENIYKSYRSKDGIDYPALRGIALSVKEGETVAIVGASGAGKSTLLHILAGIEKYDAGRVTVDGTELSELSEAQAAEYRNTKVGIVLQNFALLSDFDVYENILLPLRFAKKQVSGKEKRKKAEAVARMLGIEALLRKRISELSGGEKQRVAIARALVTSPKYILADEPTGALDSENTAMIARLLKEIAKTGVGVIIVTHDQSVAAECDRIYVIKDGIVVGE